MGRARVGVAAKLFIRDYNSPITSGAFAPRIECLFELNASRRAY